MTLKGCEATGNIKVAIIREYSIFHARGYVLEYRKTKDLLA